MTLVELLVVLAILAVVGTLSAMAFGKRSVDTAADLARASIADARGRALSSGAPVRLTVRDDTATYDATALPDGSVVADGALRTERLTGREIR